jgi:hypothetical protein
MEDHRRRRARDAGLAAVNRWTRRAVAGGIVLCGALGIGLSHLLPGQATEARHETPSPVTTRTPDDPDDSPAPTLLTPPVTKPGPSRGRGHVTSGGS